MESLTKETESSSSFIHRYNILLKLHYFLYFCSFGALYPIASITLRGRGLSDTEISYTNTIIPFLVFVTNPLFGFIADRSRRYKLTFCAVVTTCTILFGILFLLPSMKTQQIKGDLAYDENGKAVLDFCASQEVASKCSSRSECGCSYQANCTTIDTPERFAFSFAMNSKSIRKELDGKAPAVCGIQYRIPIDEELQTSTRKNQLNNDGNILLFRIIGSFSGSVMSNYVFYSTFLSWKTL